MPSKPNPLMSSNKIPWNTPSASGRGPSGTHPLMSDDMMAKKTDGYRLVVDIDAQELLVQETEEVCTLIRREIGGPPVKVLRPPSGKKSYIPGEDTSRVLKGEKRFEDAEVKVVTQYEGDWSRAKDLARCTVVVEKARDVETAYKIVKKHFENKAGGFRLFEAKTIDPVKDDCGYSGYTVFVQLTGTAIKAEIQVNYMAMMYAKFTEKEFEGMFDRAQVWAMKREYPPHVVEGGLGHHLYEVARKDGEDPDKRKAYAAACKLYYNYFRSDPTNTTLGKAAQAAILKLEGNKVDLAWLDKSFAAFERKAAPTLRRDGLALGSGQTLAELLGEGPFA
ncbi:MAG: hypothetical protein JOY64_06480 [Alphaproteobacteria bacterium]|nr:hypothetical protein [Alphaproteobacteria bacterium]MBV8407257.1 hypothetical protein [Alphaproteobacteria bacterium]